MDSTNNRFPFNVLSYIPMRFAEGASGVARRIFTATAETIANFYSGIPAIYSTPPKQGGKLVERGDINGIGWIGTNLQKFAQDGGVITFNAEYANTIGGYPKGAILCMYEESKGYYLVMSTENANKKDFLTSPSYIGPNSTDPWMRITTTKEDLAEVMEIASKAYKFKGSVDTYKDLNDESKVTSKNIGDVWDVKDTGENYAYAGPGLGPKGDGWDSLGKVFELNDYVKKDEVQKTLADSDLPPTTNLLKEQIVEAKKYADGVGESTLEKAVAKTDVQNVLGESTLPPTTKLVKEELGKANTYADGVGTKTLGLSVQKNEVRTAWEDSMLPPTTTLVKTKIGETKEYVDDIKAELTEYVDGIKNDLTKATYTFKGTKNSKSNLPSNSATNDTWMTIDTGKYWAYVGGVWVEVAPTTNLMAQHLKYLSAPTA